MPITSTVVVKSFAALLATGLGTIGGFNYVTGGNIWGTGNDFPSLPSPTSISSVASDFTAAAEPGSIQIDSAQPEAADTDRTEQGHTQADGSCCTTLSRAGFLTTPHADETSQCPESTDPAATDPANSEG